jgi:hypothetical protein
MDKLATFLGWCATFSNLKKIDWDFLDAKLLRNWMVGSVIQLLPLFDSCLSGIPSFYMAMLLFA